MLKKTKESEAVLKSIANEKRLRIVCLLMETNELSVSNINEKINLSQSALSQHLCILRQNSIVKTRRESQTIYYSLDSKIVCDIVKLLI